MFRGGRCIAVILSCVMWLLALAGAAHAQSSPHRRTVVLRVDFDGSVNEVTRDQLLRRVFEGLASAGFQVFSADELVARLYESTPALKTCADAACYRQISAALQANFLVTGKVEARRRDYQMTLNLVHGPTGKVLRTEEQRCEVCGIQEAGDTVNVAAAALRAGIDEVEAPAQVTVETQPPGALIEVDGRPLGFTPMTVELTVGVHQLGITKPGYEVATRAIEVQPGSAQSINVELPREPAPFSSGAWKAVGWSSLILGLAAIGAGAYMMALDGDGTNCPAAAPGAPKPPCLDRYEMTIPAALTMLGGGLATGFGGTVVLVAPSVVSKSLVRSDPGQAAAEQTAAWQVVLRGNF